MTKCDRDGARRVIRPVGRSRAQLLAAIADTEAGDFLLTSTPEKRSIFMNTTTGTIDLLCNLRMQVDRLQANRLKITGWDGDEALLDEIITALRTQIDWIESLQDGRDEMKAVLVNDALLEKIDDAIEDVLFNHEPRDNDSACSCGSTNNMDGDVLHGHRHGVLSSAVRGALGVIA